MDVIERIERNLSYRERVEIDGKLDDDVRLLIKELRAAREAIKVSLECMGDMYWKDPLLYVKKEMAIARNE